MLSYTFISNLESQLAKLNISTCKTKYLNELKRIAKRIKFNSDLLEKTIISLNLELLDNLIGWDNSSIIKLKRRIMDLDFLWFINIEKYIPIAHHRPNHEDIKSIIRAIQESRKI